MVCTNSSVHQNTPFPGAVNDGTFNPLGNAFTGNAGNDAKESGTLFGFRVDEHGVYALEEGGTEIWLCSPIFIDAITRDADGKNCGRKVRWKHGNRWHEWNMPVSKLAGDQTSVYARFLDEGVQISANRKARERLSEYLQQQVDKRITCVTQPGWHKDSFVLPTQTISPPGTEEIVFQTHEMHRFRDIGVGGSLEGWQMSIGRWCQGNSRLMFAVSVAFAGPLLRLCGEQGGGGFHYYGLSSGGKTTVLRAAASVIGCPKVIRTWRTTDNALEAVAVAHNDLTLFLDEIGQLRPEIAGDVAYMLGNGQGKGRATTNGGSKGTSEWSLLFLSTGETTLVDHAAEGGKRLKAGAQVRCLNIEADAGAGYKVFEHLHDAPNGGAFAQQIKEAAENDYGHPLVEFLIWLVQNLEYARQRTREFMDEFVRDHASDMSSEIQRAARRFAMAASAGELASQAGITGWSPGESIAAAEACFRSYLNLRGTTGDSDTEAAVNNVINFIETHGTSRFQTYNLDDYTGQRPRTINRAGFSRVTNDGCLYFILPEVFRKEVCKGASHTTVAEELHKRGSLLRDEGRWTKKVRLPDLGNKNVYAIFIRDNEDEE